MPMVIFLSTHSVRSATVSDELLQERYKYISIHALRKECDPYQAFQSASDQKFLSTHSVRSATIKTIDYPRILINISIHALRKECDLLTISALS